MIGVLSVFVMLACCGAFLLGLVVVAYPLKQLRLSRRWHGGAMAAGAFVVFMIAGLGLPPADSPGAGAGEAAPVSTPPVPATVRLAEADPSIRSIERTHERLVISLFIDSAWTAGDYVSSTSVALDRIIKSIQSGAPEAEGATTVRLIVMGPATDRLGEEVDLTLFNVTFDAEDLRRANTDNLSLARTLNLATSVGQSPQGQQAILAWCEKGSNMSSATSFCTMGLD